ncbi:MAG: PEP-CTERM sorting domain-containing protein [Armatimonadota bacterium]
MRLHSSTLSVSSSFAAVTVAATAAVFLTCFTSPANAQEFFGKDLNGSNTALPAGSRTNSNAARASFLSNLTGVGTESFEGFSADQPTPLALVFPGAGQATLTGEGGNGNIRNTPGTGTYATDGSQYFIGNGRFTVAFAQDIAAFGFTATDVGDISGDMTLTFRNNGGVVFTKIVPRVGVPTNPVTDPTNPNNGSALFFGYINTTSLFDEVIFGNTEVSQFDGFGFDQMTIGARQQVTAVPEPSEWLAMGMAAASVGGLMVRARRRQ